MSNEPDGTMKEHPVDKSDVRSPRAFHTTLPPMSFVNERHENSPLINGDKWYNKGELVAVYYLGGWRVMHGDRTVRISITELARLCHEVNRAYCASIGDNSQPDWYSAPDWQKESIKAGVLMHLNHPNVTPEQSHEAWLARKTEEGWAWGAVKDVEQKVHPCMVPYASLPPEQKIKDHLFKSVCNTMGQLVQMIDLD